MPSIKEISTERLEKDLEDSKKDITVCQDAIDLGLSSYSNGQSIIQRLKDNESFVETITKELKRREEIRKWVGQKRL